MSDPRILSPERRAEIRLQRLNGHFNEAGNIAVPALIQHAAAMDELLALIVGKLQEAGGTLDHKLRHQIVMDLQQDIRQGADNAANYWLEERKRVDEQLATARQRIAELERGRPPHVSASEFMAKQAVAKNCPHCEPGTFGLHKQGCRALEEF